MLILRYYLFLSFAYNEKNIAVLVHNKIIKTILESFTVLNMKLHIKATNIIIIEIIKSAFANLLPVI